MHRPYTAEKYRSLVDRIRQARDEIAITTDVIVGFPGEDEEDYAQTRALVEEIQFDNAFIFRYSTRRDTPAATMAGQIDEQVKAAAQSGSAERGRCVSAPRERASGRARCRDSV